MKQNAYEVTVCYQDGDDTAKIMEFEYINSSFSAVGLAVGQDAEKYLEDRVNSIRIQCSRRDVPEGRFGKGWTSA